RRSKCGTLIVCCALSFLCCHGCARYRFWRASTTTSDEDKSKEAASAEAACSQESESCEPIGRRVLLGRARSRFGGAVLPASPDVLPGRFHPVPTRPVFGPLSVKESPQVQVVPGNPLQHLPPPNVPGRLEELPPDQRMDWPGGVQPEEARL